MEIAEKRQQVQERINGHVAGAQYQRQQGIGQVIEACRAQLPAALAEAITTTEAAAQAAQQAHQAAQQQLTAHEGERRTAPDLSAWAVEKVRLQAAIENAGDILTDARQAHERAVNAYKQALTTAVQAYAVAVLSRAETDIQAAMKREADAEQAFHAIEREGGAIKTARLLERQTAWEACQQLGIPIDLRTRWEKQQIRG